MKNIIEKLCDNNFEILKEKITNTRYLENDIYSIHKADYSSQIKYFSISKNKVKNIEEAFMILISNWLNINYFDVKKEESLNKGLEKIFLSSEEDKFSLTELESKVFVERILEIGRRHLFSSLESELIEKQKDMLRVIMFYGKKDTIYYFGESNTNYFILETVKTQLYFDRKSNKVDINFLVYNLNRTINLLFEDDYSLLSRLVEKIYLPNYKVNSIEKGDRSFNYTYISIKKDLLNDAIDAFSILFKKLCYINMSWDEKDYSICNIFYIKSFWVYETFFPENIDVINSIEKRELKINIIRNMKISESILFDEYKEIDVIKIYSEWDSLYFGETKTTYFMYDECFLHG